MILLTGSRSLARTPAAEAWARAELAARVADALVTGDALGPDRWACELARTQGLPVYVFSLYGAIGGTDERWTTARRPVRYSPEGRRWPLLRNAAMVAWAAARGARVLALTSPWATTHGTEHTAGLAAKAGLEVVRLVCPAEFAPAGEVARA